MELRTPGCTCSWVYIWDSQILLFRGTFIIFVRTIKKMRYITEVSAYYHDLQRVKKSGTWSLLIHIWAVEPPFKTPAKLSRWCYLCVSTMWSREHSQLHSFAAAAVASETFVENVFTFCQGVKLGCVHYFFESGLNAVISLRFILSVLVLLSSLEEGHTRCPAWWNGGRRWGYLSFKGGCSFHTNTLSHRLRELLQEDQDLWQTEKRRETGIASQFVIKIDRQTHKQINVSVSVIYCLGSC